jgi:hypothetical protein
MEEILSLAPRKRAASDLAGRLRVVAEVVGQAVPGPDNTWPRMLLQALPQSRCGVGGVGRIRGV